MSLLIQSPPFDYLILTTGKTTTLSGRQQGVSVEFASDLVTSRWESAIDFNNQTRELFIYNYSLPSPATTLYTGQVAPDLFEVFDNGSCTGPAAVVVNPLPNPLPLQLVVSTWLFSDYQNYNSE